MRVLTIGLDNRAMMDVEGHSKRWNTRMGQYVDQLDVIVEMRQKPVLHEKRLSANVRILPVYAPHPLFYPLAAYWAALREHARQPYDLVTAEDPFRTGLAAALFKRKCGVALSVEYHTETFFNRGWLRTRPVVNRVYERIGRRVLALADSVRCVRQRNAEQIRPLCRQRNAPIEVIPVPTEFYDPARHADLARQIRRDVLGERGGRLLLFVGRLAPVKRIDELLRVFKNLEAHYRDLHLLIVGNGPEEERLRALSRSLGLQRVTFEGYVPENEILAWYAACDIFVNPAHEETFGRVYIEAMSTGKPVITTSGAGAVEAGLCVDHLSALVIEPGNLAALEAAIAELLDDEALRVRIGQKGFELVSVMFDYENALRQMHDFWQKTVRRLHPDAEIPAAARAGTEPAAPLRAGPSSNMHD